MRNQKALVIDQLDRKLRLLQELKKIGVPDKGWVHSIRSALNMSLEQLGKRIGITKQGVQKVEIREAERSITLNSLKEIATALDLQLVYGFVPNQGSLENYIDIKARELACKIVYRTHKHMQLENQETGDSQIQAAIDELTHELKREMPRTLLD